MPFGFLKMGLFHEWKLDFSNYNGGSLIFDGMTQTNYVFLRT